MNLRPVLELDARLSDRLRVAEKPGPLRTASIVLAHSGDSWFWGLGLLLLGWFGDVNWKEWALVMFAGIAVLVVIVMSIKFIVRRRRPEGEWGGIYRNTDPHSFPSGHAARAFMIAVLAIGLGPGWAGSLLTVWAPLVALARVAMGVHYVSDIVAGALLGIVVGLIGLGFYQPLFAWLGLAF
jgi:undecaprenyl-diphosphatase